MTQSQITNKPMTPREIETRTKTKTVRIHLKQRHNLSLPQEDNCQTRKETKNCITRVNPSPKWWWALKWANGPYPIQMHANFQILMGHLKFLWALCKIWWAQESLISTLEHNWYEIWRACIWGPAKNKVHFSKTLIVFSQNGSGPS